MQNVFLVTLPSPLSSSSPAFLPSLMARILVHILAGQSLQGPLYMCACVCAQLCLTHCDPTDYRLPGFSIHEIFQARILEWVAIFFSRDLPNPRIESMSSASLAWQVDSLPLQPSRKSDIF